MQAVTSPELVVCDVMRGSGANPAKPEAVCLGSGVVTGVLGEGGMAVVYEIWNERLAMKRAVKVLRPNYTSENRNRFDTEIKVTAQLDHPNIIRIHSVGEYNGLPYIEMEKVDGLSLAALVARRGALPLEVSLSIALVISRALNYTHTHRYTVDDHDVTGVLHRDMKPENILLSHDGKVRLTDFGIATPVNVSMHTPDGSIVGSLQYIAPEQLKGEDIDNRADIFSFGCVLYEILTGFKAFPDRKIAELIPKRLANTFDPLTMYRLSLPPRLSRLVRRCLQFDKSRRPRSMATISTELARMLASCTNRPAHKVVAAYMGENPAKPRFIRIRQRSRLGRSLVLAGSSLAVVASCLGTAVLNREGASRLFHQFSDAVSGPAHQASVLSLAPSAPVHQGLAKVPKAAQEFRGGPAFSLPDSLRKVHGMNDLLSIMKAEDRTGHYQTVLALRNNLTVVQRNSRLGVVLVMRALDKTGALSISFFGKYPVRDAEFFLTKADYQYRSGDFNGVLISLDRLSRYGALLLDDDLVHGRAMVFRARALTSLFRLQPDSDVQERALVAWRSVKHAFRDSRSVSVYREAVRECERLERI